MKVIRCEKCNKKIQGNFYSFSEMAKEHGWIKKGAFYVCADCSGIKPKVEKKKKSYFTEKEDENI